MILSTKKEVRERKGKGRKSKGGRERGGRGREDGRKWKREGQGGGGFEDEKGAGEPLVRFQGALDGAG